MDWEIKRDLENEDLVDRISLEAVLKAEQFECCALWPLIWKSTAIGLLTAADKIYNAYSDAEKREMARFKNGNYKEGIQKDQELQDSLDTMYLFPIFLLLIGYAIENLLKGILYSKHPGLLEETEKGLKLNLQKLNQSLKGHELTLLYNEAAKVTDLATLDTETEDILGILEHCVIWQGRYAIPLNLKKFKNKKQISSSQIKLEKINDLVSRISSALDKIPNPPTHMEKRKKRRNFK